MLKEGKKITKERQSNLEFLRIISMLLIVAHHYSIHGKFGFETTSITFNRLWVQFISVGGKLGVDVFILITGYFMLDAQFKWKKILNIWMQVCFYSILCFTAFHILNPSEFTITTFIKAVFPVIFSQYWFATSYIGLLLLAPFVNVVVNSMSRHQYVKLLSVLFVIWSVIPTLTTGSIGYSDLGFFLFLYLVAAYIRKYPHNFTESFKFSRNASIVLFVISIVMVVLMDILGLKYSVFGKYATYFSGANRIPTVLFAIALFNLFRNINLPYNKGINYLAGSMFGVYLLHDNKYVRLILWQQLFKSKQFALSSYLWIHSIIAITVTFIICIIIDIVRREVIEKVLYYIAAKLKRRKL